MGLDVYLEGKTRSVPCQCDCGHKHTRKEKEVFYDSNITHNLIAMAEEAEIYGIVWHPEENGIKKAKQLIEPLRKAIAAMKAEPARFEKHNPSNNWGSYENFVPWLEEYLAACEAHPQAHVRC